MEINNNNNQNQMFLLIITFFTLFLFFNPSHSATSFSRISSTNLSSPQPQPKPSSSSSQIHGIHPDVAPSIAPNPDIKRICDSADYPSLCVKFVTPFFKGKSDPISVLEMAMRGTMEEIKMALDVFMKLTYRPTKFPSRSKLNNCKEMYSDASDNLESAIDALQKHDIHGVSMMLSAALTDFETCHDELNKMPSSVADFDDKIGKMVTNCLAIASQLR